ncbi:MAG TPA: type II secretion system F family protein [Pirellulales bacterium]|nr:type II secretion system F family protein [Pirellulales bacterium]
MLKHNLLVCKIPLERLALFCQNLGLCLHAGMDVPTSLKTCTRSSANSELRQIIEQAAESTAAGMSLSEALAPWRERFPAFFVPVLQCGEQSGKEEESLGYLQRHCRLLVEPARVMRNTWLAPLSIMLAGSTVCAVAYLLLASLRAALAYVAHAAMFYGIIAAIVAIVLLIPQAKWIVDALKLLLPAIGQAERELAMSRFFHAMNLLYSTGGQPVQRMIRLAAESADNLILRWDYLRAASAIERGETIAEAFATPRTIPDDVKHMIATGDEAGKLEDAFDTVSRTLDESAQHRLLVFQQLFFRAVALAVVFSMTMTITSLLALRG